MPCADETIQIYGTNESGNATVVAVASVHVSRTGSTHVDVNTKGTNGAALAEGAADNGLLIAVVDYLGSHASLFKCQCVMQIYSSSFFKFAMRASRAFPIRLNVPRSLLNVNANLSV